MDHCLVKRKALNSQSKNSCELTQISIYFLFLSYDAGKNVRITQEKGGAVARELDEEKTREVIEKQKTAIREKAQTVRVYQTKVKKSRRAAEIFRTKTHRNGKETIVKGKIHGESKLKAKAITWTKKSRKVGKAKECPIK